MSQSTPPSRCLQDTPQASSQSMLEEQHASSLPPQEADTQPQAEELPEQSRIRQLQLYRAALNGDWAVAKGIFDVYKDEIGVGITTKGNTALHVAAAANQIDFVKELVKMMNTEDLANTNNETGSTALFFAAASGNVELARETMKGNNDIAVVPDENGKLPIVRAASLGHKEIVEFLYEKTKGFFCDEVYIELLVQLIETDLYDAALQLLRDCPQLAVKRDENGETALHVLARKNLTSSNLVHQNLRGVFQRYFNLGQFPLSTLKILLKSLLFILQSKSFGAENEENKPALELVERLWKEVVLLCHSEISELIKEPTRLIFDAAKHGNVQFLSILIREYPDLMWKVDENDYTIFHIAVSNRLEKLFKFIYDMKANVDLLVDSCDGEGNNILHLAGKLAPPHRLNVVSGSALQMQRELLWFEAVENVVPKKLAEAKNKGGLTPRALFSEKHKELKEKGETWMKDTASSCMIVATLIATIVFAAAITVPGGNKEDTGLPFFRQKASFKIFAVSNVISLVASSISIVNFLSIVALRYAEQDFLHSLPRKLVVGFAALFVAIAAMMVVFSATSYIVFKDGSLWIAILAIVISSMPVILFAKQHFLFFHDILRSTCASHLIPKGKTSLFYKAGETKTTKRQRKTNLFNGSNLTISGTSSCSTNV